MINIPPVAQHSSVSPEDRITAIDFVNRVNWFFEVWDVEAMVESFLPDSTTYHFGGTVRGRAELEAFFRDDYPYLVPGVARHAANHIVDDDGPDGVVVRYHNLLIRYGSPDQRPGAPHTTGVVDSNTGLPAAWIYSPMLDRLTRTERGWRIRERRVGHSVVNARLSPQRSR